MDFKEVTKSNRCSICGKSSWCSMSISGEFRICRREQHDGAKIKTDKNGEVYFIYETRRINL